MKPDETRHHQDPAAPQANNRQSGATDAVNAEFSAIFDLIYSSLSPEGKQLLGDLGEMRLRRHNTRKFADFGHRANNLLGRLARFEPASQRRLVARALIGKLAHGACDRVGRAGVTDTVMARAVAWCSNLADFLKADGPEDYGTLDDYFLKDFRFSNGLTVPCGGQVIDLASAIGPKTAIRFFAKSPVLAARAWRGPVFRLHTESRYLDEFNETGWKNCYHELADLLELHPRVAGLVSTSWFYDPSLAAISPRLAYLHDVPVSGGALVLPHTMSEADVALATATSPTRRAAYQAGAYRPITHSILWSRDRLLAWSRNFCSQ